MIEQPTLHKPVPMESIVHVPNLYAGNDGHNKVNTRGKVVGIAFVNVIFNYIVLLDESIDTPHGKISAIVCDGANLRDENGVYAWRLDK